MRKTVMCPDNTQVNILEQDQLFFIIHDGGCHWTLLVKIHNYKWPYITIKAISDSRFEGEKS